MIAPNWENIVPAIHERDRHRCMNCYRDGDDMTLDVHHIVPRGQGGSNRLSNLILLCRECHDAAHGRTMAPRVRFYSYGQMDSDEFEMYREFFNKVSVARFDEDDRCWYIPLADAEQLVDDTDESLSEQETVEAATNLATFM